MPKRHHSQIKHALERIFKGDCSVRKCSFFLVIYALLAGCSPFGVKQNEPAESILGTWYCGVVLMHESYVCLTNNCDPTTLTDSFYRVKNDSIQSIIRFTADRFYEYSVENGVWSTFSDTGKYWIDPQSVLWVRYPDTSNTWTFRALITISHNEIKLSDWSTYLEYVYFRYD
jgi:hypothetical protein